MTDFDALLTRSFAEAPEPADDGFSVNVGHAVMRRESAAKLRNVVQNLGLAAAVAAVAYGLYGLAGALGQDLLAMAGLEIARAHSVLSQAPSVESASRGLLHSLGAGTLTTILLTTAALAGGAVAYRATQD